MSQVTSVEQREPDSLIGELMSSSNLVDPYPLYEALRANAPNHKSALGVRFISDYATTVELMRSPAFGQSFGFGSEGRAEDSAFLRMLTESLILINPPQHTRLRRLVQLAFSPRMIERLAPKVQTRIDGLLDQIEASGKADIVADYAALLPSMVVGELIGTPPEDYQRLVEWEETTANAVKPVLDEELLRLADVAVAEFHAYIRDLVAQRRSDPQDDLVSALVAVEAEGDRLTEPELVNLLFTIMAAGSQTTTALISTGTWLLLTHPEERQKLAADPGLIFNTVDEIIRFDAPVQNTFIRVALEDTQLGGVSVPQGEPVAAFLGAAHRDPAVFPDPDRFLVDRREAKDHIGFGVGIHACLGRSLGRQQGAQAIKSLFERFPGLTLADENVTWRRFLPVRQLERLDVTTSGPIPTS